MNIKSVMLLLGWTVVVHLLNGVSPECQDVDLSKTCLNANDKNCQTTLFQSRCQKSCDLCPQNITSCVWIPEDESQTFQERCVNIHNFYRCLHNSPIVTGSNGLEDSAQSWADHLSQIGERLPSNTADVGENIYFLFQPGKVASAGDAIIGWYSQYFLYGFNNPGLSPLTEDFTQLVWATTTTIGCGRAVAGSATYIVVHYNPPGNQPDIFQANVKQIKSDTCETRCGVTSYCQGLDPEMSTCMACDGGFSNCNGRCTQYCPKPQGFNGFWREWCHSASSCTCDENFNFFVDPPIFPGAKCV